MRVNKICAVTLAFLLLSSPALAFIPQTACTLNEDRSSAIVIAMNSQAEAFSCTQTCHVKTIQSQGFQGFQCSFSIGAGASERQVCELAGDGPGYYVEARTEYLQCNSN